MNTLDTTLTMRMDLPMRFVAHFAPPRPELDWAQKHAWYDIQAVAGCVNTAIFDYGAADQALITEPKALDGPIDLFERYGPFLTDRDGHQLHTWISDYRCVEAGPAPTMTDWYRSPIFIDAEYGHAVIDLAKARVARIIVRRLPLASVSLLGTHSYSFQRIAVLLDGTERKIRSVPTSPTLFELSDAA